MPYPGGLYGIIKGGVLVEDSISVCVASKEVDLDAPPCERKAEILDSLTLSNGKTYYKVLKLEVPVSFTPSKPPFRYQAPLQTVYLARHTGMIRCVFANDIYYDLLGKETVKIK